MAYRSPFFQPRQDTGWGLIYRLNLLLGKVETDVDNGDLDSWNKHIDAIFRNILYKEPEIITYDENKKIKGVTFTKADTEVFSRFAQQIKNIKLQIQIARTYDPEDRKKALFELRERYYNLIFKKDVWIRKKMFKLDLYLRQIEHDPRKAIYGG